MGWKNWSGWVKGGVIGGVVGGIFFVCLNILYIISIIPMCHLIIEQKSGICKYSVPLEEFANKSIFFITDTVYYEYSGLQTLFLNFAGYITLFIIIGIILNRMGMIKVVKLLVSKVKIENNSFINFLRKEK